MFTKTMCQHGTPATLSSDVECVAMYGVNPDCFACPDMTWVEPLGCDCDECLRCHGIETTGYFIPADCPVCARRAVYVAGPCATHSNDVWVSAR